MKTILAALAGGLLIAAFASHAELPSAPAKSEAEKATEAQKAAAAKAKDAADLTRAQDKAVANYRKNNSDSARARKAGASSAQGATAAKPEPPAESGADHAKANSPGKELTGKEAQTEMPTPGQANDHSSTGRETVPSGR
jgi:hypothetical protein